MACKKDMYRPNLPIYFIILYSIDNIDFKLHGNPNSTNYFYFLIKN